MATPRPHGEPAALQPSDSASARRRRAGHRQPAPQLDTPPGTLVADTQQAAPSIQVIRYGPAAFEEHAATDLAEVVAALGRDPVTWVSVTGLGDLDALRSLAASFGIHPLAMEDILDTTQPAKLESYDDRVLLVVPRIQSDGDRLQSGQLSMVVGPGLVVTFEEAPGSPTLDRIRDRLRRRQGRVRDSGSFFLAYAIVDSVIDGYFPVLSELGEELDRLEEEVIASPRAAQVARIRSIRRELLLLRRLVGPIRDLVSAALGLENLGSPQLRPYLRDALDHSTRLLDLVEMDRLMASELMELHLAATSNRLGEINRFLTIIATIFIPLGTIAGVYGMNFDRTSPFNMPELGWRYGYPFALALMGLLTIGFLAYFWRKGWLSSDPSPKQPPRHRRRA